MEVNLLGPALHRAIQGVEIREENTDGITRIHIAAKTSLSGIATGELDNPSVYVSWKPNEAKNASDLHFLGFQCCEFALPVRAPSTNLEFNFFSRPDFKRPRSVFPLLIFHKTSLDCCILAPLDNFHEQILAVTPGESSELRWGWHGDLNNIPAGFSTTLLIMQSDSPRELIQRWGQFIREQAGISDALSARDQPSRYADVSTARLSMWTDNGASYWYRREPGLTLPETLEKTVELLDKQSVPVHSIELDSWFYRHETTRNVTDVGYLDVVPPTGMMRWEPRKDIFGPGGISELRKRMGNRPLILHSRHISSASEYITDGSISRNQWWIDGDRAHPIQPELFRRWMQQAADWGATAYEQDWIVEIWLGVRQLRESPGRIATWQRMLNSSAHDFGISLIWCMATPADMAQAVSLKRVVAVRTSDDYRYSPHPSDLWKWHLTVNCITKSLGLWPFKDVFMTHTTQSEKVDIEGDPNAELEALLAALSAGPVGIGDRMGRTDRNLIMRTCRSDGVLIKPDTPLAVIDKSLRNDENIIWADTVCGSWRYVVAINVSRRMHSTANERKTASLPLNGCGAIVVYNWRTGRAEVLSELTAELGVNDWALWVICPIFQLSNGENLAIIGDASVYATMGDRRMRVVPPGKDSDNVFVNVLGEPGERVRISYWICSQGCSSIDVIVGDAAYTTVSLPT